MERKKPSVKDIVDIKEKLKTSVFGEVHKLFDSDQVYYNGEFLAQLGLPGDFEGDGTVLPTGRDMVDAAVDHTDISNARVYVNKKGATETAEEAAEMFRKFCLGIIYRTNTESTISPWRIAAKHFWLHGVKCYKTVWNADLWASKPTRGNSESDESYKKELEKWEGETQPIFPIIIDAVNPYNIMPDPWHREPQFFIEIHEKSRYMVEKNYPKWASKINKDNPNDTVEWVEYWDDTWKCFLADDEPVLKQKVVKHNYGFIPYVLVESGLGLVDKDNSFENRWVGILRYMYDLLVAESRNYSIGDIITKSGAFPWGWLSGENAKNVKEINRYYGNYQPLPEGVEIHTESPDVPAPELLNQLYVTSQAIAAHAAPNSVRGLPETNVRSAADRRLMIAEAGSRYNYSKHAFQYGTNKVLINCARLFKNVIPGNIKLWNWSNVPTDAFDEVIDREKLKEPFNPYVEFAPISEEDEYRRHDDLIRLMQGGLTTKGWSRRQMTNVDPQDMEEEEEREKIANSPAVLEAQNAYLAQMMQLAYQQRTNAQNLQSQMAQGVPQPPMGGMTTNIPNVAAPGSAQEQQNILRNMRSQTPMSATQGRGGGGPRYA